MFKVATTRPRRPGRVGCAEAEGTCDEAAALLDEALERLGPMTPLPAADLRQRRNAIPQSA
ncbi:hypothetical protein F1D05_07635 [Kribbella qitaiheensis]|uniref:Uncharacterized protein n=1 Tax=Kribbella qitaiheensis TaxID=1544730 RepID=A0A7G6WUY8_9ACTN|nr:hypothetical protein [Kribbella qitaiheensis]QNE17803.1 hypothetical protein F1D05_07635 [Kribbella qitaiheensis]